MRVSQHLILASVFSFAFCTVLLSDSFAFGEILQPNPSTATHNLYHSPIEHVEITLPAQLVDGFEVVNQSLSMEEAVQIGLQKNLTLHLEQDNTHYQRTLWKMARAKRLPILTAGSFSYLRSANSGFLRTPGMITRTVSDDTFSQEFSLYAKMPLFTGGLIRAGIQMTRSQMEGAKAHLSDTEKETAFQIRKTYLSALLIKAEHHIHQKHKEVQEELLRQARSKYRNGKGLKADVLRIHAEVAEAQEQLNNQHNRLNQALFELKALMGIDLSSEITLTDQLKRDPWTGQTLSNLIKNALKHHPKVVEAHQKTRTAKAQINQARSEYFPQIYGQVSGNVRLPENEPELGTGIVGLFSASWALLNRERDHRLHASKIQYQKTQTEARQIELQLAKEMAQAWSEMTFASENVNLSKTAVNEAKEELRLMQRRFEVGRALNVEVQDAILTLRQAQLSYARTLFAHELAKTKLKRITAKAPQI